MVNWTIEQQAAINARDSNLLVTAAAGSGKTAVLVQRVINIIIEDGVDIDKLLIVTFTRAAASEMKERIRKAIMKRLEASGGLDENLRRQIDLLGKAQISTIHSFCQSVVKNNFHLAEIDPALKVGEETEMLLLKTEAVEEALEREYEEGQDYFYELLEMFSAGRDDRNLQDLILTIYDFIRSKPDPYGWLQEKTADFGLDSEGFAASLLAAAIAEQSTLQLEGALELLQKAAYLAGKPGGPDHYLPVLIEDQDKIQELIEILPASLPIFIDQLLLLKFSNLKGGKTDCDVKLREEAKDFRDEAKKVLDNIKNNFSGKSLAELMDDLNRLHPAMEYLEK
ncbi:MAG: UvrD-helicase domain-containing protein, partial [Syntrophomonadaceae bacterium]|nr:UvrD-helicase domain-containing protein [Syntrophomonadaceae bacterium]